jgi:hypothetical protein
VGPSILGGPAFLWQDAVTKGQMPQGGKMKSRIAFAIAIISITPFFGGAGCLGLDGVDAKRLAAGYQALLESCIENDKDLFFRVERELFEKQIGSDNADAELEKNIQGAVDDPKIESDPEKYASCLAFLEGSPQCSGMREVNDQLEAAGCNDIFKGTVETGETCVVGQCVPGAYCKVDPEGDDDCGTCTAEAKKGEDCADVACEMGLSCDQDDTDPEKFTCEDIPEEDTAALGDACTNINDCTPFYACGPDDTCVEASVVGEGDACTPFGMPGGTQFCEGSVIAGTLFCDADVQAGETDGTCQKAPSTGEPCGGPNQDLCNGFESHCSSESGNCEARAKVGDACVPGHGPGGNPSEICVVDAYCDFEDNICKRGGEYDEPVCAEVTESEEA